MNFISYAPNFEDVLLWRALRHIEAGYYLDAGAADPLHGSVTQAFYQRGWRGINLEPAPALQHQLAAARPADLNLALGVLDHASAQPLPFFDAPDSQRASFVPAAAQASRAAGLTVLQREAAVTTLADVCREHVSGPVHFLNVAVNGSEAAALAGMDWQLCRPWIVLVQSGAAAPAITAQMQAARYLLAYADGHKQYFVAQEQAALAAALTLPPHGADQFTLMEDHPYAHPLDQWRQRTEQAEQEARAAQEWVTAHEQGWRDRATHAETQARQAQLDKQHTETTLNRLLQDATQRAEQAAAALQQAQAVIAHEAAHGRQVSAELAAIYASRAWKLSKPIRGLVKLARLVRTQLRHGVWRVKHTLVQGRVRTKAALLGFAKARLQGALHFVTARPALAFFLRRQIGRYPRLVGLLRAVAMRAKAQPAATDPAGVLSTDLAHLPASARQVYADLQRALQRPRPPSAPH